ncbi:DUF3253 domain-containing protein [Asticcacaulis sp. EMRT-3]|uniref:DUF3253 domain-containing protein n=1 Tax=Asticcacaulis sp. EMRT-3 TaxID=3040349 RepID=UPI0024AF792C|nr:DUF3253 domain-containing protein [Asticcacaulis sp. EMRT-3]MDI7774866.1 DUF3253 domain-containing protein [Asticcacaulis sp. EMRT-3]
MSQLIEETIQALLSQAREGESISPNDVAKAVHPEGGPKYWQRELPKVRAVILGLARKGQIDMLRKGKPVAPEDVRGIYRIRRGPVAWPVRDQ